MLSLKPGDSRRTQIESDVQTAAVCVELGLPTGREYLAAYPSDITIDSQVFQSSDAIISMSVPASQQNLSRDFFAIGLESTDKSETGYRHKFTSSGWTGVDLVVRVLYILDDNTFSAALLVYKGLCNSVVDSVGSEGPVLTARFSGQLSNLRSKNIFTTTPNNQSKRDSEDTCFAHCHNNFRLYWGSVDRLAVGSELKRIVEGKA